MRTFMYKKEDCLLLIYASRTGNVRRFVKKLNYPRSYEIVQPYQRISEPFILITYTASLGAVPKEVTNFLEINSKYLQHVIGSGNKNWGLNYCQAAYRIQSRYGVSLLFNFEMAGVEKDVHQFNYVLDILNQSVDFKKKV